MWIILVNGQEIWLSRLCLKALLLTISRNQIYVLWSIFLKIVHVLEKLFSSCGLKSVKEILIFSLKLKCSFKFSVGGHGRLGNLFSARQGALCLFTFE
jgi:hypothetical protein